MVAAFLAFVALTIVNNSAFGYIIGIASGAVGKLLHGKYIILANIYHFSNFFGRLKA
jgi:hypothetical protein